MEEAGGRKVVGFLMTHYLTGECDINTASIDPDRNTFKPKFQHVFEEVYSPTYLNIEQINEEGEKVIRRFDMARRRFVD